MTRSRVDISSALTPARDQEIVVGVYAPVDQGGEPIGKQRLTPTGIFYTSSSGIWQTPWLEPVPAAHVDRLVDDARPGRRHLKVAVNAAAARGDTVQAVAYRGSRPVGTRQRRSRRHPLAARAAPDACGRPDTRTSTG